MFPIHLIRHENPELFFAIVSPVGADVERVYNQLSEGLKRYEYELTSIRVIEQLKKIKGGGFLEDEPQDEFERIQGRMDAGDKFRALVTRMDALALLSISEIRAVRKNTGSIDKPLHRRAYLLRSLKRPEEVVALRRIYGSNLIVIGTHSPRDERVDNLSALIAKSNFSAQKQQFRNKAETLVLRDESDGTRQHGQQLRNAFAMADFFMDSSDPVKLSESVERFLGLLFGKPVITPTKDEFAMAQALLASLRSAELGRQVGAAIADQHGNVVAVGTNEVPKAGGGSYWEGDRPDRRDWVVGFDSSERFKQSSLGELLQVLSKHNKLSAELMQLKTDEQIQALRPLLKQTRYMQLIEFIRAVHAEMGALIEAAFRGISVAGCTMYVTTFPCHECARHIIGAGISKVVYIEPYAKSLAVELHDDSLQLDSIGDSTKVPFLPFLGVAPRNYSNLFSMPQRKDANGNVIAWNEREANPRVSGSFWSYLQYEKEDLATLTGILKAKGLRFDGE
jgi:deoxycytidylate deaminase